MRDRTKNTTHGARSGHPFAALALALGFGLFGLFGAGCGAPSRTPLSARTPGTTTLLIANHLGPSDEIDHLRVSVDETLIPLSTVPPRREVAAALASLRLPPGPHSISVRVTTHGADGGVVVVEARQTFHVAETASEIDIDLRSRLDPGEQDARVAVDLSMVGGHMNPELGAVQPEGKDARCAPLQPIPRALCRAASDLDEASKRNDLVGVLCIRDKLGEMRKVSLIGETGGASVAGIAVQRVQELSREIDRCAGDVTVGADGVTVIKPGGATSAQPLPSPRLPASQFPAPRSTARL